MGKSAPIKGVLTESSWGRLQEWWVGLQLGSFKCFKKAEKSSESLLKLLLESSYQIFINFTTENTKLENKMDIRQHNTKLIFFYTININLKIHVDALNWLPLPYNNNNNRRQIFKRLQRNSLIPITLLGPEMVGMTLQTNLPKNLMCFYQEG